MAFILIQISLTHKFQLKLRIFIITLWPLLQSDSKVVKKLAKRNRKIFRLNKEKRTLWIYQWLKILHFKLKSSTLRLNPSEHVNLNDNMSLRLSVFTRKTESTMTFACPPNIHHRKFTSQYLKIHNQIVKRIILFSKIFFQMLFFIVFILCSNNWNSILVNQIPSG